jgi:hypothetical protein
MGRDGSRSPLNLQAAKVTIEDFSAPAAPRPFFVLVADFAACGGKIGNQHKFL